MRALSIIILSNLIFISAYAYDYCPQVIKAKCTSTNNDSCEVTTSTTGLPRFNQVYMGGIHTQEFIFSN